MTDKLRRCPERDEFGHRCKKHILHIREVPDTKNRVEIAGDEGALHRAFGREWK